MKGIKQNLEKKKEGFSGSGQAVVIDHSPPISIDHFNLLTINKVRWSDCSGEDWSKRAFFPLVYMLARKS